MKVLTARVVDGQIEMPEGALGEATMVTLLVPEVEESFRLSAEEREKLMASIAQADRGEVVDGWQLLASLGA